MFSVHLRFLAVPRRQVFLQNFEIGVGNLLQNSLGIVPKAPDNCSILSQSTTIQHSLQLALQVQIFIYFLIHVFENSHAQINSKCTFLLKNSVIWRTEIFFCIFTSPKFQLSRFLLCRLCSYHSFCDVSLYEVYRKD